MDEPRKPLPPPVKPKALPPVPELGKSARPKPPPPVKGSTSGADELPKPVEAIPVAPETSAKKPAAQPKLKAPGTDPVLPVCNVIDCSGDQQHFWRFAGGKREMKLVDLREAELDTRLEAKHMRRDRSQMWHAHCQNDAWLPVDQVLFRVLQLPQCDPKELPQMVELQLERLSPLPVSQVVWTCQVAPDYGEERDLQTVVVMIAARAVVEQHIGRLEAVGCQPDRLETPVLHQVLATPEGGERPDGAWIYPHKPKNRPYCVVAWWDEGVLMNITVVFMSSVDYLNELSEHLTATTWAGEAEGWLTGATRWHLVVDKTTAEDWLPVLNEWAGQGITVEEPPHATELAALSASRAGRSLDEANLLPPEYRARKRADDIDRVWIGAVGWMLLVYALAVGGYQVGLKWMTDERNLAKKAADKVDEGLALKKRLLEEKSIIEEQQQRRTTAIECFRVVADNLPSNLSLGSFTYRESSRFARERSELMMLNGGMTPNSNQQLENFIAKLESMVMVDPLKEQERNMFRNLNYSQGRNQKIWNLTARLNYEDEETP